MRTTTRAVVVLPADIEVPTSRITGAVGTAGATGSTKSRMLSLRPPRVTWPRYTIGVSGLSQVDSEVASPNRPAPVSACISPVTLVWLQSPTTSSVAERLPSAPTTKSPATASTSRPLAISNG
jgi:hypothetical protein